MEYHPVFYSSDHDEAVLSGSLQNTICRDQEQIANVPSPIKEGFSHSNRPFIFSAAALIFIILFIVLLSD